VTRRARVIPALVLAVPALLLIGVLTWPLVFSGEAFNADWMEQLWFIAKQAASIRTNHLPSLFLNYRLGVFYPHYVFYGATLYVAGALIVLALGDAPTPGYVLTYLLGFAAAYGGWYWLARMFGIGRWRAHVPGVVFVTSAYYLTLIYARGDWPEFIGISMIPLMLPAGIAVLRAKRQRVGPALALLVSCILFFGSHSLTIVWGSTTIALAAFAILICVPQARRALTRAGVLRAGALGLSALLVNAWFLLPAAAYESETRIASIYHDWRALLRVAVNLVSASRIFTFSRASATAPGIAFALSLPILAMGWVLVSVVLALWGRGLGNPWTRVLLICSALSAAFTVMMTHVGLILVLPRAYATLQYSYRLESYILLALSGAVLAALVLAQDSAPRGRSRLAARWTWALIPVLAVAVVGAVQQTDAPPGVPESRGEQLAYFDSLDALKPNEALFDYLDMHQRRIKASDHPPELLFPTGAVRDETVSGTVLAYPGELISTNLFGPPNLVHVSGAKIVAINAVGYDVLEVGSAASGGAGGGSAAGAGAGTGSPAGAGGGDGGPPVQRITVTEASTTPIVLGRWLTLLGVLACAVLLLTTALQSRSGRARSSATVRRSRPAPDTPR
jgi:hypothetical protein